MVTLDDKKDKDPLVERYKSHGTLLMFLGLIYIFDFLPIILYYSGLLAIKLKSKTAVCVIGFLYFITVAEPVVVSYQLVKFIRDLPNLINYFLPSESSSGSLGMSTTEIIFLAIFIIGFMINIILLFIQGMTAIKISQRTDDNNSDD